MPRQDGTIGGRGFLIPGLGSYKTNAAKRAQKAKQEEPKLMKATRTKRSVLSQEKPAPGKSLGSKKYTRGSTDLIKAKPRKKTGGMRPKRNYGQMD